MLQDETVMPLQPIVDGRFVQNSIVRMLLDSHPTINQNYIAERPFTNQERMQFAQLIGYSLSGFSQLSYVDDETFDAASNMADGLSEDAVRNDALRYQLEAARDGVKKAACTLFSIHEDDLHE